MRRSFDGYDDTIPSYQWDWLAALAASSQFDLESTGTGPGDPIMTTAERSAERIQMEQDEQERYGDLLADVKFLRSRDFSVVLDAVDDDGLPTLLCDGRPTTATQLREKAARERRLLALPTLHLL